jgi:arginyl-tRNA synthetase
MGIQARLFNIHMFVFKSLIRKAQQLHSIDVNLINTLDEAEVSLSDKLFDFSEVLAEAGEKRNPAVLANYVFELAKEYNRFYHELPVLKEENPAIEITDYLYLK